MKSDHCHVLMIAAVVSRNFMLRCLVIITGNIYNLLWFLYELLSLSGTVAASILLMLKLLDLLSCGFCRREV